MRFARHLLLATLAFGAAACSDDDLGPTRTVVPPLAYVRYINATPDTLNHTVRWVDDIEFTPQTFINVAFRTEGQGGWQGLRSGSRHFKVFTYQQNVLNFPVAGNTTVLKDTTFNFETGKYYTILYTGFTRTGGTPAAQLRIFEDEPPASPATGTLIRVFNLAYNTDFDLYMGQGAAFLDTNFVFNNDTTITTDTTIDTTATPPDTTITVDTIIDTTYVINPDTTITVDTSFTVDTTIFQRDTIVGHTFTAGELGTLLGSGAAANIGTASQAYTARALGNNRGLRLTNPGAFTTLGIRVTTPNGLAESADFEAAGGTNINGSVLTMWVFPRKTAGSPASTGVANTRPSVLVTVDRSPARTIAP